MHWAHMSEDNTMIGQQAPENCLFLSLKNVVTSTYHHVQIFFFLTWVQKIKLGSPCLQGKQFTDQMFLESK